MEEANLWLLNFDLMVKLVADRRDTVWAFILKNAYRPAYLRRTKVDLIIGNPPWLSYRDIAEKAYKSRIRDLTFGYGLLTPSERHLFTIMDTSTLFYVHCETEFLKPRGKISFVMPKATIVPSKQHALFQTRGFSRIHDLSKVTVLGNINQHFFNIKSWKVDPDQLPDTVACYTDSTIALPIMAAYALTKRKPRPLRRLSDRREQMLARLVADFSKGRNE